QGPGEVLVGIHADLDHAHRSTSHFDTARASHAAMSSASTALPWRRDSPRRARQLATWMVPRRTQARRVASSTVLARGASSGSGLTSHSGTTYSVTGTWTTSGASGMSGISGHVAQPATRAS